MRWDVRLWSIVMERSEAEAELLGEDKRNKTPSFPQHLQQESTPTSAPCSRPNTDSRITKGSSDMHPDHQNASQLLQARFTHCPIRLTVSETTARSNGLWKELVCKRMPLVDNYPNQTSIILHCYSATNSHHFLLGQWRRVKELHSSFYG